MSPSLPSHGQAGWDADLNAYLADHEERLLTNASAITSKETPAGAQAKVDALSSTLGGTYAKAHTMRAWQGVGSAPTVWDDFHRADGALNNTFSPSGHKYSFGGTAAHLNISGNRYAPTPNAGDADILYATHASTLTEIVADVVFHAGTGTGNQNTVIGACEVGFGSGSVQLAVYEVEKVGFPGVHWQLFYVPTPVVDPYPILATGSWTAGFTLDLTGATTYRMAMRRVASDTLTLELPDGQVINVTDPNIATYWGKRAGFQSRRPNATDGHSEFISIATGGDAGSSGGGAVPGFPSVLHLTGDTSTSIATPKPSTPLTGDVDFRFAMIPDDFTPAAAMTIGSIYGLAGDRSSRVWMNTTGLVEFSAYLDGTTASTAASSVALPSTATAIRVTRAEATGDVIFYTSTDDPETTDLSAMTWTQLGTTRSTTAGTLANSTAGPTIGLTGSTPFIGRVYQAEFRSGIGGTVVAAVDFRHLWSGTSYTGTAGNVWTLAGTGYNWLIAPGALSEPNYATNGVAVSGTPSAGKVLTATSATTADWETPSGGLPVRQLTSAGAVGPSALGPTAVWSPTALAAGALVANTTLLNLRLGGTIDCKATSGNFSGRVKVNGTIVQTFVCAASQTNAATNIPWRVELDLYVGATGASGSVTSAGSSMGPAAAGTTWTPTALGTTTTVDLSSGLAVTVELQMATSDPANINRLNRAVMTQVA